jgi:capsule polysaccharide export protein KpsE/RkpR
VEASLTPTDPGSLGLSNTLEQFGALNSVFGKQADVEVALRIGNSIYTRERVILDLSLESRLDMSKIELHRWLEDKVEIRSLRGGIILIQMDDTDKKMAQEIVAAFTDATRDELAKIMQRQTKYKKELLEKLVAESGLRLSKAQSEFDAFRLQNGYADPGASIGTISGRIPQLRSSIEGVDQRIAAASRLFTPENIAIVQLQGERDALTEQLNEALDKRPGVGAGTVGEVVDASTKAYELDRELKVARSLYTNYIRYLEGTTVEDLTSKANIRLLEQPYVSTERQYRWSLLAAAAALFLLWMAIEFYRLRPPLGAPIGSQRPPQYGVNRLGQQNES